MTTHEATRIGTRLELFVEDGLIEKLGGGASLRVHNPVMREISFQTNKPWEGNMCGGYKTYFKDGDVFRMYYQGWHLEIQQGEPGTKPKKTERALKYCYAESRDGVTWERPALGLYEVDGSRENNIVFMGIGELKKGLHGFAPFLDSRPNCPADEKYKALGASDNFPNCKMYALKSADGFKWELMQEEAVITKGKFDSQNLAFWDESRGEYRAYVRDIAQNWRVITTCVSKDFLNWTEPQPLAYTGTGELREQLYTNQVLPYYRAPHLFVGFPARYVERKWNTAVERLPEAEHRKHRASLMERYGAAVTDTQFMASRDGNTFKRHDETFIKPGLRTQGSWTYGDCYQGWGLLETKSDVPGAPDELSIYTIEGYWRGAGNFIRRHTVRVDGFVSLHAGRGGGELVTKPIVFSGERLVVNIATSAAGGCAVEVQTPDGVPIEGFKESDCVEVLGDSLALEVTWAGGSVSKLAGQPVRLRFVVKDADLYSYRFE